MKLLTLAFNDRTPTMGIPKCLKGKYITGALNVEPKVTVETLSHREVRYAQHELVERMNAKRTALGSWLNVASYRRHDFLLFLAPAIWHLRNKDSVPRCFQVRSGLS